MKFKDLNNEVKVKFLKDTLFELYPFTLDDFQDFENMLDFKVLSKNQYIDWNLTLLQKYSDKWDWEGIENNPIICREINLGLFFPGIVKISAPKCDCYKGLDYCNMEKYCNSSYDRVKMKKKQYNSLNPDLFGYVKFLIEENQIDNTVVSNILLYDMQINYGEDYEIKSNSEQSIKGYEDLPF